MKSRSIAGLVVLLGIVSMAGAKSPATRPAVYRANVRPHWLTETSFWYTNDLEDGNREFVFVDAEQGTREIAFDTARLSAALNQATGDNLGNGQLPINIVAYNAKTVTVSFKGVTWQYDRASYGLTKVQPTTPATQPTSFGSSWRANNHGEEELQPQQEAKSPDSSQVAAIRDNNVVLGSTVASAKPLSKDGTADFPYDRCFWSPDGKTVVAYRVERGDHKPVYRLESSPLDSRGFSSGAAGRAILHEDEYTLPGDKLDSFEINLFDAATGRQIKPSVDRIDADAWGSHPSPVPRWRPDGHHFIYEKYDRGHQRLRLIEVDAATGATRDLIDERSDTFIWSAHIEDLHLKLFNYLKNNREVVYVSERSGWRQLYLLDLDSGQMKPVTAGQWPLRGVLHIDEAARQIWFAASGVFPGQDPYFLQIGRVNFDGTGLTWLTEANGDHAIDFRQPERMFSPRGQFIVISHSTVASPPVTELRRVSDGKLVVTLETGEMNAACRPLESFVAKGRDGTTDIWGVICRPKDFDPSKQYPIVESVYAGPQGAYAPHSLRAANWYSSLADLGFIVVQADGMGTAFRSKAFHDVCWHNLADAGFADRIAWIKAAAAKYPYMDISRVGIYGTSSGGQSAAGAMLFHNDFYKAAVANCGCHDNRMDKISWNEQWMGWPIGPQYSACSNIDNAAKLKGRLQLVLGELDDNVPVASTYRLVNALVQNGKEFDFVLIPNARHGASSPITQRKLSDFFVRYLQGREPVNPN